MQEEKFCVGLELNNTCAIVSYIRDGMTKPETVGTIAGSEKYQIPLAVGQRKEGGQWLYGEDALRLGENESGEYEDSLLTKSLAGEHSTVNGVDYPTEELLALFLKKVLALPGKLGVASEIDRLVVTVENVDKDIVKLLNQVFEHISLREGSYNIQDYRESFCYFALNQSSELWNHDVVMFRLSEDKMKYFSLVRERNTIPQLVTVTENEEKGFYGHKKDERFLSLIKEYFDGRIISSVYLVGDGFEGGWLNASLKHLCRNRKVFMGKNLYSVGACYMAYVREKDITWPFIYMGENEMKVNVSLKVDDIDGEKWHTLVSAGENWYEAAGECEVILGDVAEIDFYLQKPQSRDAVRKTLELQDLPKRPARTTRLRIRVEPVSDKRVNITIKDVGFGELFRSSDKIWNCTLEI